MKEETLEDKKKQYQTKAAVEERSKDKILALSNQRSQEVKAFDNKKTEVQDLINTLTEAKSAVAQLSASNNFLQQPEQIEAKLVKHSKNLITNTHGYVNLV